MHFCAEVKVAVKHGNLPVDGIQLYMGNDLAEALIVPNVTTVDEQDVLVEAPHLYPICAVTRAQAKLQSTFPKPLPSLPQVQEDLINQPLSREESIKAQNCDPSLAVLLKPAYVPVALLPLS